MRLTFLSPASVRALALAVIAGPLAASSSSQAQVTIQAESGTVGGGTAVAVANSGYSGSGYLDYAGNGSWAEWTVNVGSAGSYRLDLRYANGSTADRTCSVLVNGISAGSAACTPGSSWADWRVTSVEVSLNAGNNTVRITASTGNGGPNLDQLTATFVSSSTPPPPSQGTVQAESGSNGSGSAFSTGNPGYNGTGFIDFGGDGSWAQVTVNVASAGSYTLGFRYANGSGGNRSCNVTVNGTGAGTVAFVPTATWATWQVQTLSVSLVTGDNTVRVTANSGSGGPNLDEVAYALGSTTSGTTGGTTGSATGGSTGGTTGSVGGTGLQAAYFNNRTLSGSAALSRVDGTVNFDWSGSPGIGVNADSFSVRWTGKVEAPASGTYTFQTESDDGIRFWVSGQAMINNWTDHAPTVDTSSGIALTAGQKYDVILEFYEATGGARAGLRWRTPGSSSFVTIPQSQLFPAAAPTYHVTTIRFFPRSGYASRMLNGRFTGSNEGETTAFNEIARISSTPADGQWTELTVSGSPVYRWLKYEAPVGGWGNVAEIEFYSGDTKLTGTGFGSSGSQNGNDFSRALDGSTSTFFDGPIADGMYVGINLGPAAQAAAPTFSPAPGTFSSSVSVTLSSSTAGASIRYTTDGSTPTPSSGTLYSGPFSVSSTRTVAAVAYKTGLAASPVVLGTYTISSGPGPVTGFTSYHLGNSLTDTLNGLTKPICDSAGFTHTYLRSTIPGAPTDWIWDHPNTANGEKDYRVVFDTRAPIHHMSQQPFAGHARSIENEADYGGRFYNLARQKSPNVQHWLYVQWPDTNFQDNWAQAKGNAAGLGLTPATTWEQGVDNHRRYIEMIRDRMDALYDGKTILVAPAGPALVRVKQAIDAGQVPGMTPGSFFSTHFPSGDNLHLNSRGAYVCSLVFFCCMYQTSPVNVVTYANSGLTQQQAVKYQEIVWDYVRNYAWSGIP